MKQFDEKFSRKAKEAFENYSADNLAEEGWNAYIKKYGERGPRAFIIPLWAKVASVAAVLTIVVLLTNRIDHRKADETGNQLAQENGTELSESAINREDTAAANPAPDQVLLTWMMPEQQTEKLIIERSKDGQLFEMFETLTVNT
jgi:hypothetical protein